MKIFDDRLAELEAQIREWFIVNDMVTDTWDWFELKICSKYENKYLEVYDQRGWAQYDHVVTITGKTTKEMFNKAFEFFKLEVGENEIIKANLLIKRNT